MMKGRVANAVEIAVAFGAAVAGLGALGAASLGQAGFRLPGLAFLVVGAVIAASLRWRRERDGMRARNAALTTLAWASLGEGYPERAKAALDEIAPSYAIDLYCLAAVESARGRLEPAIVALELARTAGTLTCDGAKLLVDCCARLHGVEHAVTAALQTMDVLGVDNCKVVVKAAVDAGAHGAAATLTSAIQGRNSSRSLTRAHAT